MATIKLADGRSELYQWDTGRKVVIDDESIKRVHYQNRFYGRTIDVDVSGGFAIIPDRLLQSFAPLVVFAWAGSAEDGYTKIEKTFEVHKRNKPADYVFTPVDQKTLDDLQKQIGDLSDLTTEAKDTLVAAINEAARTGGGAGSMALRVSDGYVQYSTDGGETWQNLIAVADLKGAKGDKGDPGVPGKNGSDATVTVESITGALGYKPAAPSDIPVVPDAEISANTAARHLHANKAVLDGITGQVTADKVKAPDHTTDLVQYGAFQVGAQQIISQIPTVPTALKNPNALTIKIGSTTVTYDGITAEEINQFRRDMISGNVGDVTVPAQEFSVTNHLTNCATSNASTKAAEGDSYQASITANSGYTLDGATVSITMGGTEITASAYTGGVIQIPRVTGAIVIAVSAAVYVPSYTNILPTGLTPNTKVGVWDGKGYRNGAYASGASPYYGTDASCFCTGAFPYNPGDVFYVKGATLEGSGHNRLGALSQNGCYWCKEWASLSGMATVTKLADKYYKIELDSSHANYTSVKYIMFSAQGTASIVVTKNEEIV